MAALWDKRLLVVSGKGGVGKSTVSAALGLAAARAHERTLICELDTEPRIGALLGHRSSGPEIAQLEENLWAVDVRPDDAMREYAHLIIKSERVIRAVFENRLVRYFLRFIPSLKELVLLGKVLYHVREKGPDGRPRFDRVILDAPATGHALRLLSVPQVLLDTVPPGPLSKEALWMRDMLVDHEATAAVLVSLPEEMPLEETRSLHRALLDDVHMAVGRIFLNQAVPDRFEEDELASLSKLPELRRLAESQRRSAQRSRGAEAFLRGLGADVSSLPLILAEPFGREAVERICEQLQASREALA